MKARRVDVAILAAGLLVLVLLAWGREAAQRRELPPSVYSTYDVGPNGYRALYDVLLAAGVPVRRFQRDLGRLDPGVRTLIVSAYAGEPAARPIDKGGAARLATFVRDGGRLVVLDSDFAGPRDVTPNIGTSVRVRERIAIPLARNRFTAGVERVEGPIDAVFPFALRRGLPLLANARGIVAVSYPYGKGEVVAVTAPQLFGNASLRDADNLAFAYNAIAGYGPAAFDEYVHGYDDDLGLWQALPAPVHAAFWIVAAVVALALVGANVPFAPAIPPSPPDERDSRAYVDAMALLMRRARAARAATAAFARDATRRTRGRDGARRGDTVAELERLRDLARPSDAAVLRAATLDFQLRKETS